MSKEKPTTNRPTKEQLRKVVEEKLPDIVAKVNEALSGKQMAALEKVLARIGRGAKLPHWYEGLKKDGSLPNVDGKTVGSIIEMVLVGVLETHFFASLGAPPLHISPARGVDLPDLDLGVKSPSENFCTSEPFFSAYERLLGSDHDIAVLLTNYQQAKKVKPVRLQIIGQRYLTGSQVADTNLCRIAKMHRDWLVKDDEARAKRVFRFLAYVNQSDWRAKRILRMVERLRDEKEIKAIAKAAEKDFLKTNQTRLDKDDVPLPDGELHALVSILKISPLHVGVIDAAENWVVETVKDAARAVNDFEWKRLLASPLDGKIGMSLALQWRYNFGRLFGQSEEECEPDADA